MAIGRTDERDTPCHPTAHYDTVDVLRARSRNPSGPRSSIPHRKAGHMIALVPAASFSANTPLNPTGRPHMDGRDDPGHDDGGAAVAPIGVLISPRILRYSPSRKGRGGLFA